MEPLTTRYITRLALVNYISAGFSLCGGEYRFCVLGPPRIALAFTPLKCELVSDDTMILVDLLKFR